jgi:hypothetical protein
MFDVWDTSHNFRKYYPMSWPIDIPWLDERGIRRVRIDQEADLEAAIDIEIQESEF